MRDYKSCWRWAVVVFGVLVALTGCTYAAVQRLPLDEQTAFYTYRKVMTGTQVHTYVAKATPAEREAYLQKIGVIQRFQALEPADRAAVLHGIPQVGMSAEALLFLWGDPYYTAGDARRYAHWYYLGSSFSMAASGNQYRDFGNQVDVYLVNGHVAGWVDYTPALGAGE
jgi:hypothetical protein